MTSLHTHVSSTLRAIGLALVVVLSTTLAACSSDNRLVVHTEKGEFAFNIELVDTPEGRAKGLMFRQSLAPDAGMLFDFKEMRETAFWMRNTFIPLDMIFIDAAGVVKTVHVNAKPQDPTSIPSEVPVQFVLEIRGGRSVEIGLKPGDTIEHPRMNTAS